MELIERYWFVPPFEQFITKIWGNIYSEKWWVYFEQTYVHKYENSDLMDNSKIDIRIEYNCFLQMYVLLKHLLIKTNQPTNLRFSGFTGKFQQIFKETTVIWNKASQRRDRNSQLLLWDRHYVHITDHKGFPPPKRWGGQMLSHFSEEAQVERLNKHRMTEKLRGRQTG